MAGHRGTRSAFIGRETEFSQLAGGLEEAIEGHGQGFLVLGDPGIGKSRLALEVAEHADDVGALVLWGRCWEAGGAPPYWPWTEVLRAAAGAVADPDDSTPLHEAGQTRTSHEGSDPLRARFELFRAVGAYLRRQSAQRPILVVLDDLHASDLPSLLLLEFLLGGGLRQSRVAVLALGREHELLRSEELGDAALRVRRLARTIRLQGLQRHEVAALIEQRVATPPSEALVEAIHRATEGNPLFIEELGALVGEGGALVEGVLLPEGIRQTIRQRFAPLSQDVLEVLSVGAGIGREFDLGLVEHVTGRSQAVLASLVEEALSAGLLASSGPGRYRFGHILVRDVLYGELSAMQRAGLHVQVGLALEERYKAELEDHLDALAHHFFEGLPAGDVDRAVGYLMRSGHGAESRMAYEAAVRQYELALGVAESTGWGGESALCDILLALGRAYDRSGRTERAKDTFRRASGLARQLGDGDRLAQAALGFTERIAFQQRDDAVLGVLEEALAVLGGEPSAIRARLLAALARILGYFGLQERMETTAREAVEVARVVGDPHVLASALRAWQVMLWSPDRIGERMEAASEAVSVADSCGDSEGVLEGHMARMICYLELGDARQFDRALAAYGGVADQLRQPRYRFVALSRRAMRELMLGNFDRGWELAEEARGVGRQCEDPDAEPVYHGVCALPARDLGAGVDDIERYFVDFSSRHTSAGSRALLAVLAVDRGHLAAARSDLATLTATLEDLPKDMDWLLCLCLSAEVAHALGDAATAAVLYPWLAPYERRCALMAGAVGFAGSVAHYLGLLSAALGAVEQAEAEFGVAAAMHADMGARPWLARTLFEHGQALLAQPADHLHARGQALVAEARGVAEELGMAGLLRRMPQRPVAAEPAVEVASLRRQGAQWKVRYGPSEFFLPETKGLHHLVHLLRRPGQEVHVLDLVGGLAGPTVREGDGGPVLDGRAKVAYRARLEALREELDEAEAWADEERAFRARGEMDAIVGELSAAVGLGGRDRRTASAADRARVSVRKAIARVLRDIQDRDPALGRYLTTTIRTGTYCVYEPDPRFPLTWEL